MFRAVVIYGNKLTVDARTYTSLFSFSIIIPQHETARVVWSWHDNDPVNGVFQQHQKMGTTSLNLLGGQINRPQDPSDAMTLTIAVDNVGLL